MVICPKCNQPSQSDKICSNCWADLKAKLPKKTTRDLTKMPLKNILILAATVVGFGVFLIALGKLMVQQDASQNTPGVINPK
jgi:hypothetical protein